MEGRYGQGGDPWTPEDRKRAALNGNGTSKHAALNGTSKHVVPQRPPGMIRVEMPPAAPRVARPKRQAATPGNRRRTLLTLGAIFLACIVVAFIASYIAANVIHSLSVVNGAATTATDFLTQLSGPHPNYEKAYADLGPNITLQLSDTAFAQQAQANDACFGMITSYSEVPNSATVQGSSQTYTYKITRSKPGIKPYQLQLSLQQDQNDGNNWRITSYGNSLGPGQPTCGK
jgi:hypothetical protein